jgi:hypothetical protein
MPMNKFITLLILFFALPTVTFANGFDERYTDGVLVGLSMAPLSPFVGEKVGMLFSFRDANTGKYITNISEADITIDTFIVDSYKAGDRIFEQKSIDSSIGSFNFQFEFQKQGLYEIHVIFKTPDGKEHNVGYTKQIRINPQENTLSVKVVLGLVAVLSSVFFALGYYLGKRKIKLTNYN